MHCNQQKHDEQQEELEDTVLILNFNLIIILLEFLHVTVKTH